MGTDQLGLLAPCRAQIWLGSLSPAKSEHGRVAAGGREEGDGRGDEAEKRGWQISKVVAIHESGV